MSADEPPRTASAQQAVEATAPDAPPVPAPAAEPTPRRRHTKRNVLVGVGAVVLLLFAAGLLWGLSPNKAARYDEGIDYGLRERNTLAYASLVNMGIDDPVVAMVASDASVAYDLARSPANGEPAGDDEAGVTPDQLQRGVIGAIAEAVPGLVQLTVSQHDLGSLRQTWVVQMADVEAFFAGELSFDQFEARIVKTVAPA